MATNTYVALDSYTVTGSNLNGPTGVTFSNISPIYTDLIIEVRMALTAPAILLGRFNGDSSSLYSNTALGGNGSSPSTNYTGPGSSMALSAYAHGTTNWSNWTFHFNGYSATDKYKTVISRGNNAAYGVDRIQGNWANQSAISSINIFLDRAENILVGSTFTLYGIKAETPFGAPKATGGTIYYGVDGYTYHKFTSTGTFAPTQSLTADILVVAGGGSCGYEYGAAGGAGGLLTFTGQSLSVSNYTCTVGSGGSGFSGYYGVQGNPSQFQGLTQCVGGGAGAGNGGAGGNGGSGGGASKPNAGGNPTSGQGNAGATLSYLGVGGGGGAGSAGLDNVGGIGLTNALINSMCKGAGAGEYWGGGNYYATGVTYQNPGYYLAGGGGGNGGYGGYGGGGGGNKSYYAGLDNTGGGGGSSGNNGARSGGSGVVIVRYLTV